MEKKKNEKNEISRRYAVVWRTRMSPTNAAGVRIVMWAARGGEKRKKERKKAYKESTRRRWDRIKRKKKKKTIANRR